jgi:hypothetical protein
MPELPVKESRLSELHLPEISRKDIMRSLSEMRMPDVELPDSVTKRDWPKVEMPDMDLGKAVAGVAAAAHIGRRSRSRWPFAVGGLILAGLATAAVLSNETVRAKISEGVEALRERISAMRSGSDELDIDLDEPIAFDAAETAPITETSPYSEGSTETAPYPSGLGSNGHEDGIPAFEESSTSR